uniref:BLOC-1-related complex subunit 7 n=1 Tax=Rhabditophanes sp. KR3021 TaxID=114890 RepID=A0AC35U5I9_9BILA
MDRDHWVGRTRLPKNIQDIIINTGSLISDMKKESGSNDILNGLIKQYITMDSGIEGSLQGIKKVQATVENIEKHTNTISDSITDLCDAEEKLIKIKKEVLKSSD